MRNDPILAEVDGEGMMIDVLRGTSYFLNETALFIFKRWQAGESLEEIEAALVGAYDVDEQNAAQDIREFLAKLEKKMAPWGRNGTSSRRSEKSPRF